MEEALYIPLLADDMNVLKFTGKVKFNMFEILLRH